MKMNPNIESMDGKSNLLDIQLLRPTGGLNDDVEYSGCSMHHFMTPLYGKIYTYGNNPITKAPNLPMLLLRKLFFIINQMNQERELRRKKIYTIQKLIHSYKLQYLSLLFF